MSDDLDFYDLQARQQWDASGKRKFSPITGHMLRLEPGDVTEIKRLAGELRQAALGKVADDDRCRLTELPKSDCAHCGPSKPRKPVKVNGKDRLITANRSGRCAAEGCREPFDAGQVIERMEDGTFAGPCHVDRVDQ